MYRRCLFLGLPLVFALGLLLIFQIIVVQGDVEPLQTTFSAPNFLTVSPDDASILHTVDIDDDGDWDVFSAGLVDGQLIWYENRGLSTPEFTIHTFGTELEQVGALTTADLDGDNDLDLLVGEVITDAIYWYENRGGFPVQFEVHPVAENVDFVRSLQTVDLDGDGDLDILAASSLDDTVAWYENDGAAPPTFTKQAISTTFDGAYAVFPADINKDGHVDVVAAAKEANSVVWYEHDGAENPSFSEHIISTTAVGAVAVAVADLNADGHLDVLSASVDDNTIAWYESDGAVLPTFTPHLVSDAAQLPWAIFVADIDDDGDLDVASASENSGQLLWYESDGTNMPTFTLREVAGNAYSRSVQAQDLDGDSDLDLFSIQFDHVVWYENDGTILPDFTFHYVVTPTFGAHGVHAADLDGDGDMDVLSASADDGQVAWYESDGRSNPTFTAHTVTTDTERPLRVHAADINGDNLLDIVSGSRIDGKIAWYPNDGGLPPVFTMITIAEDLGNVVSIDTADLDNDGDLDIVSGSDLQPITWFENGGGLAPTFTKHPVNVTIDGDGVYAIIAIDIDGDADIDIAGGAAGGHLYWFENDGEKPPSFIEHLVATNLYSQHVYAADVNGDGATDLLTTAGPFWNNNTVSWYENDGAASPSFTAHIVTTDTMKTKFVYAADIDSDGDMDLFSASRDDYKVVWYENDGADPPEFTTHIISEVAYGARSVFVADLDGDGYEDILFASFEDDKIAWHQNIPPLYKLYLPIVFKE